MVRLNLNKVEGALEDSNKCLKLDPAFVKGYHRKAQALTRLNQWDEAIQAAEEGSKLEPNGTSFAELIQKAKAEREKDAEDKAKLKRDAQDVRVELHNASTARQPAKKEKKEGDESEDISMRGYKKTSDGKTTSFFHTEISEEAKRLIEQQGFGKPKKLEGAVEEVKEAKGGGSQWNQAGTYEEKGMTKWVQERLQAALTGITFQLPQGAAEGSISTTGVDGFKGDASIAVSRGKRRHIMDFSFDVSYEGRVGDASGKGKLLLSEVSTGDDDAPEVKCEINNETPRAVREVFEAFVKPAGQGLQPLVMAELKKLIEEYKGK